MSLNKEHDLHKRRFGRNMGVGLLLGSFVVLVLALTCLLLLLQLRRVW